MYFAAFRIWHIARPGELQQFFGQRRDKTHSKTIIVKTTDYRREQENATGKSRQSSLGMQEQIGTK
jgi:hypothetical protein